MLFKFLAYIVDHNSAFLVLHSTQEVLVLLNPQYYTRNLVKLNSHNILEINSLESQSKYLITFPNELLENTDDTQILSTECFTQLLIYVIEILNKELIYMLVRQ